MWNEMWISKQKECMSCVSLTREVIGGIYLTCELKTESQNKRSVWVVFLLRGKRLMDSISHVVKWNVNLITKRSDDLQSRNEYVSHFSLTRDVIGGIALTCGNKSEFQYKKLGRFLIQKRICESYLSHAGNGWWNLSHAWNQIWISKQKECVNYISLTRKVIGWICITCEIKSESQTKKSMWVVFLSRGKLLVEFISHVESNVNLNTKSSDDFQSRNESVGYFCLTRKVIGGISLTCEIKSESQHEKLGRSAIQK